MSYFDDCYDEWEANNYQPSLAVYLGEKDADEVEADVPAKPKTEAQKARKRRNRARRRAKAARAGRQASK